MILINPSSRLCNRRSQPYRIEGSRQIHPSHVARRLLAYIQTRTISKNATMSSRRSSTDTQTASTQTSISCNFHNILGGSLRVTDGSHAVMSRSHIPTTWLFACPPAPRHMLVRPFWLLCHITGEPFGHAKPIINGLTPQQANAVQSAGSIVRSRDQRMKNLKRWLSDPLRHAAGRLSPGVAPCNHPSREESTSCSAADRLCLRNTDRGPRGHHKSELVEECGSLEVGSNRQLGRVAW